MALTAESTGPELHGVVQAGTLPVAGASVYLYAAGTSGYASASTPIFNPSSAAFVTTDSSGGFTIPSGYACPSLTSQVYLVALGGQAGTSSANPNLGLMTALGACGALSSTPVVINEVTTVASATALATFSADNVQSGKLSYLYVGSSSSNATVGLANAFAAVNNLVDITTGRARYFSIAGNAAVPYAEINTLADALNACAVTTGGAAGDNSACGNLFTYTDPLGATYPVFAPTDTLQAALNLMKTPAPKVGTGLQSSSVYGLASLSSPYQPILSSAPTQWWIALNYTSGGGFGGSGSGASGSSALAIDGAGNVWITNKATHSVSEWSSLGAAYSPAASGSAAGGFTGGGIYAPSAVAVDTNGFIWIANSNGTLTKLDLTGTADANGPFSGGGLSTATDIAIDGTNNVWVTNGGTPGSLSRFNARGISLSPAAGYTDGITNPILISLDGSGNIWVYNQKTALLSSYAELNSTSGALLGAFTGSASYSQPLQLAINAAGDVWSTTSSQIGISKIPENFLTGGSTGTYPGVGETSPICAPQGMAFDGSNRLWVSNAGSCGGSNTSPQALANLSLVDTTVSGLNWTMNDPDPALANGTSAMVIDNAGNIWALLNNNTVQEYVGIATPVLTPLSQGVKQNKLGTKP
jgi:hypothetical protein